jgi:hypothetical protein
MCARVCARVHACGCVHLHACVLRVRACAGACICMHVRAREWACVRACLSSSVTLSDPLLADGACDCVLRRATEDTSPVLREVGEDPGKRSPPTWSKLFVVQREDCCGPWVGKHGRVCNS